MRILMAFLFVMLGGIVHSATIVVENSWGPFALSDGDLEECYTSDCFGSRFAEPRIVDGFYFNFDVPTGMRLARARIDYTISFAGVGDFDYIRFWTNVEIVGPMPSYHGATAQAELTAASPTKEIKNSFKFPVSKSTMPPFSQPPYFVLDASGNSGAWGRNPSQGSMEIGLQYRFSYTTVPVAPVPLPASGIAMLLALSGLVLASRRRAPRREKDEQ